MISKNRSGKRLLILFLILTLICGTFSITSFAASDGVRIATNGAAGNYAPGSVIVVYGRAESGSLGLPGTDVLIQARIGTSGADFYAAQVTTDDNGYFKAGFNVPSATSNVGKKLIIKVDGSDRLTYTLQSQAAVTVAGGSFSLTGFTAPGYLEGETARYISASTTKLGIVFNKNVNYFNNKDAADLQNLGINLKNKDCFRLYKGATGTTKVSISPNLISTGGTDTVEYTKLDGTVSSEQTKDIIYISLGSALTADTTYRLVVSKDLSSNSSSTLGADQTIYFTTAAEHSGGSTGTTGATGTTGDVAAKNNLTLNAPPTVTAGTATTTPTDTQVAASLKNAVTGDRNILTIAVTKDQLAGSTETVGEVKLALSASQVTSLANIDQVVYDTPIGQVVIPQGVLGQTSGNISLSVKKTEDEDSFQVTLTDSTGTVSTLKGRVSLVLPVANSSNNVVLHNGQIMKDALIDGGNIYAVTKKFSVFSAGQNTVTFSDINGHWAAGSIEFLAARGIVAGTGANTFSPNKTVTRFEFVKMLVGAFDEIDPSTAASAGFSDVQAGAWYTNAVNWAAENDVVKGTGSDVFGGGQAITRQDMAVILDRLAGELDITLDASVSKTIFADDANLSAYAKSSVYAMQQAGIISGKGNNLFDPKGYATRAETSAIITSFIKAMVK